MRISVAWSQKEEEWNEGGAAVIVNVKGTERTERTSDRLGDDLCICV